MNVTVVDPTNSGFVSLYPGNYPIPSTSTLNFGPGQTRTNNAILPLSSDGSGTLAAQPSVTGKGNLQLVVDANGYFEVIRDEQDRRRICGLPPTFVVLEAVQPTAGRLLSYGQYVHPRGFESVSFASVAFYR